MSRCRTSPIQKARTSCDRVVLVCAAIFTTIIAEKPVRSGDCDSPHSCEYFSDQDYGGRRTCLEVGEAPIVSADGLDSFRLLSSDVALLAERVVPPANYQRLFFYSEVTHQEDGVAQLSMPMIAGTNQYDGTQVRVSCVLARGAPLPRVEVPIDVVDIHPAVSAEHRGDYRQPSASSQILTLDGAYFWENAEQLGGLHGPYEEINIAVVRAETVQSYIDSLKPGGDQTYSYANMNRNADELWNNAAVKYKEYAIPGPVYAFRCAAGLNPHSEWIDSDWGTRYSNLGLVDWRSDATWVGTDATGRQRVGLIIHGADPNGDDFIDAVFVYKDDDVVHFLVGAHGVIRLKNLRDVQQAIDRADAYTWDDWDGTYPENVCALNPTGTMDACWSSCCQLIDCTEGCGVNGSRYKPFDRWERAYECLIAGSTLGLIAGKYPSRLILSKRMTLKGIGGTARFGD